MGRASQTSEQSRTHTQRRRLPYPDRNVSRKKPDSPGGGDRAGPPVLAPPPALHQLRRPRPAEGQPHPLYRRHQEAAPRPVIGIKKGIIGAKSNILRPIFDIKKNLFNTKLGLFRGLFDAKLGLAKTVLRPVAGIKRAKLQAVRGCWTPRSTSSAVFKEGLRVGKDWYSSIISLN